MRREALVLGAAMLLCAACSSAGRSSAPSASTSAASGTVAVTTTSLPATTTSLPGGINPDAIPRVITIPYVDAVFKVLEHLEGDVSRSLLAAGRLTPTATSYLRSIFNDPLYAKEVTISQQSIAGNTSNVRRPPGDVVLKVVDLISASPTCIFASTSADYSAVLIKPETPPASAYIGLDPKQVNASDNSVNPTPWAIFFNAVFIKAATVPNQCASHS